MLYDGVNSRTEDGIIISEIVGKGVTIKTVCRNRQENTMIVFDYPIPLVYTAQRYNSQEEARDCHWEWVNWAKATKKVLMVEFFNRRVGKN